MNLEIEWARAKEVFLLFGIGRTTLYRLANEGRIRSKNILASGAKKGTRLFDIGSIRKLLNGTSVQNK